MSKGGVYAIRHIVSGKIYIGSAVNFKERWKRHRRDLGLGRHHSRHLQRAWDKYGPEAFLFEILETISDETNLIRVEQEYLDRIRPHDRRIGYNISPTAGSTLGVRYSAEVAAKFTALRQNPSPETRAKLSKAMIGRKLPEKTRAKMSETRKNETTDKTARRLEALRRPDVRAKISEAASKRRNSDQTKANMSKAQKERSPEVKAKHLAIMRSPEVRAKMSAAAKNRRLSEEGRLKRSAAMKALWQKRREALATQETDR